MDCGPQFASKFWKCLFEVLGVDICLSTAFYPETDGSTEVTNQVMEQYLKIFCNFKQNDWFQFLPLAEFTYNISVNSTTKLTPFFVDAGINLLFNPVIPPSSTRRFSLNSLVSVVAHAGQILTDSSIL
jgi:hypothetical protein